MSDNNTLGVGKRQLGIVLNGYVRRRYFAARNYRIRGNCLVIEIDRRTCILSFHYGSIGVDQAVTNFCMPCAVRSAANRRIAISADLAGCFLDDRGYLLWVRFGFTDSIKAATPATCGQADDVPLKFGI